MESTNIDLLSALVKWINTFEVKRPITSCNELVDGKILWAILKDIDPQYFSGNLPENDVENWIPRWQNLKHICRVVGTYMREECECLPYLSRNLVPDLKAVALDGSKEATAQLIQAVFLAAMYSPNSNQRMVRILDSLGTKVALPLANAITDMQERDRKLAEDADNETAKFENFGAKGSANSKNIGIGRDAELESEERLIQAHASIKRLETHSMEQSRAIEALRADNSILKGKVAEAKLTLDNENRRESEGEALKSLRAQYARDKDYIVELEGDLESTKSTAESQRTQLERLKADTTSKQELRDGIQLIRIERDELASKAKVNDNLRKKIESLQNEEKRNHELRQQLEANNESLQQYDELEKTCEILRTAHAESQRTIANQEVEIFHIKETKKRLEQELEAISLDLKDSIDQGSKYEETIVELQSRLNDVESEQAGNGPVTGSLDAEMAQKELEDRLQATRVLLRWQRGLTNYSKSATSIKSAPSSGKFEDSITVLQKELKALEERNNKTEAHFLEVANENRGLRNLIKAATGDEEIDKAPFVKQNERLLSFRQAAEEYKRKYFDLAAELKAIQKPLSKPAGSDQDASDQQGRPIEQLLQTGKSDEVKNSSGVGLESQSEERVGRETSVEKLEAELKVVREQERANTELYEQSKLTITNLERELRLMMSSWYDLGSRMQSGNITSQRRPATPRSWIGRQRAMVG